MQLGKRAPDIIAYSLKKKGQGSQAKDYTTFSDLTTVSASDIISDAFDNS